VREIKKKEEEDGLLQIRYVDSPTWRAFLQQIWLNLGKRSGSYIGVKMMFSFFLSIYSQWCVGFLDCMTQYCDYNGNHDAKCRCPDTMRAKDRNY